MHPKHPRSPSGARYARHGEGLEFDRLAFFSDAVFAIAMTLLVVGIGIPDSLDALHEERLEIYSFVISFIVLGNYWLAHHRFFSVLGRFDNRFMVMNLVYLAAIAFIPFPTALVGEFEEAAEAVVMYAIALGIASLLETVMYAHAYRSDFFRVDVSPERFRFGVLASAVPVVVFAISIPIALWNTSVALLSWLSVFAIEGLLGRWGPPDTETVLD